ncbi:hypothetical protein SDC9_160805 [bioreactor metagenome]|uniref:Uncharacterized protein n=1 Tax=bioreactor metagenome TaxID=1076179 RepID=A0A645FM47_9ZZZZ
MTANCMDERLIDINLGKQFGSFLAMLFREHTPVDIVQEANQRPILWIMPIRLGEFAHGFFHTIGVIDQGLIGIVRPKQSIGLFASYHDTPPWWEYRLFAAIRKGRKRCSSPFILGLLLC